MPQDQVTLRCDAGKWTEITNGDVTNITFQVLEGMVYVRYTVGSVEPSQKYGALYVRSGLVGQGELNRAITQLTSLIGANRVWVKPVDNGSHPYEPALIYVDHA